MHRFTSIFTGSFRTWDDSVFNGRHCWMRVLRRSSDCLDYTIFSIFCQWLYHIFCICLYAWIL